MSRSSVWYAIAACVGATACGNTTYYQFGCYPTSGTFENGSTSVPPDTCSYREKSRHGFITFDDATLSTRWIIALPVSSAHASGDFQVAPWKFAEPSQNVTSGGSTIVLDDDPAQRSFEAASLAPSTAFVFVVQYRGPIANASSRIPFAGMSGTITIDPSSKWPGAQGDYGEIKLTLSNVMLQGTGSDPSIITLSGTVTFGASGLTADPVCNDSGSGGASCVTFKTCQTDTDCMMSCDKQICRNSQCCELDGAACADDAQCCGGHCVNQMCMNATEQQENMTKCAGQGSGSGSSACGGAGETCAAGCCKVGLVCDGTGTCIACTPQGAACNIDNGNLCCGTLYCQGSSQNGYFCN